MFYSFLHKDIESASVFVVNEDVLPAVSAEDYVIKRTGIMEPRFPCHAGTTADKSNNASLTLFYSLFFSLPGRIGAVVEKLQASG